MGKVRVMPDIRYILSISTLALFTWRAFGFVFLLVKSAGLTGPDRKRSDDRWSTSRTL
jgi:hypothetical protein